MTDIPQSVTECSVLAAETCTELVSNFNMILDKIPIDTLTPEDALDILHQLDDCCYNAAIVFNKLHVVQMLFTTQPELREVARAKLLELNTVNTNLINDPRLFQVLTRAQASKNLSKEDRYYIVHEINQLRANESQGTSELQMKFLYNIQTTPVIIDLSGIDLTEQDLQILGSSTTITLTPALYHTIISESENTQLRELVFTTQNKTPAQNNEILDQYLTQAQQNAQYSGFNNAEEQQLISEYIGTPENLTDYFDTLLPTLSQQANKELSLLKSTLGIQKLHIYDIPFYIRKFNKSLCKDSDTRETLKGVDYLTVTFEILSDFYRLNFTLTDTSPLWHDNVRTVIVSDPADGSYVGTIFLDLYARNGKQHQPCMLQMGKQACVVVTSFNTEILGYELLKSLWHELGHAMHHLLAQNVLWKSLSGIVCTHDFIECHSQFMEELLADPVVTKRFGLTYCDCFTAFTMLRQAIIGRASQLFFQNNCNSVEKRQAVWLSLYRQYLPEIEVETCISGLDMSVRFMHLVNSGQGGKYYSYLWSKHIATSILNKINNDHINIKCSSKEQRERIKKLYRRKHIDDYLNILRKGGSTDLLIEIEQYLKIHAENNPF